MSQQVDAQTIRAAALFAENRFVVPDFQRRYSWSPNDEVQAFWDDLHGALVDREYFLGLIILSEESSASDGHGQREVVDGQQRLVTLSVLANVLRLKALHLGRRLVADSLKSAFLWAVDYRTDQLLPRLELTDPADGDDFAYLIRADSIVELSLRDSSAIHSAHAYLLSVLETDLANAKNAALRVGQWADFISKQLSFAVFAHPDRGAAFRVYEVINTRGKELTPSELIKSYLIGSSGARRVEAASRWAALEGPFEAIGALDQLTTFVRHVVTLRVGYVTPRELYQVVTREFGGSDGADELLAELEHFYPTYLQMIDPAADFEATDVQARAFNLLDVLSLGRFRPIVLAAQDREDSDLRLQQLLDILVPGALSGTFGTGSIEAQFARAARRAVRDDTWDEEVRRLGELRPSAEEFDTRLRRGVNKQQARVLLSAVEQATSLPDLHAFAHQIRPKAVSSWPNFSAEEYERIGSLVGNWVITKSERRPQGARTPEGVSGRLFDESLGNQLLSVESILDWAADDVERRTSVLRDRLRGVWYGH